jgi:hypothetical protein
MPNHGLTRDEVQRIADESVEFAQDEDVDAHRRIDLVNQVAFDTHKAEQMLAQRSAMSWIQLSGSGSTRDIAGVAPAG